MCVRGEVNQHGACNWCQAITQYSLYDFESKSGKGNGEICETCDGEKMVCLGGDQIYPRPGWWRMNAATATFYKCLRPQSCLGYQSGLEYNPPTGACEQGYQGKLCAQCAPGYSRSSEFSCRKCPHLAVNILLFILFGAVLLAFLSILIFQTISNSSRDSNQSAVYLKILMNHFQVLMLLQAMDLQWPSQL